MLASKPYLTQADAQKILDAANKYAADNNFAVTIAAVSYTHLTLPTNREV